MDAPYNLGFFQNYVFLLDNSNFFHKNNYFQQCYKLAKFYVRWLYSVTAIKDTKFCNAFLTSITSRK